MRLVTFRDGKGTRIGTLDEAGKVLDLAAADAAMPRDMLALIAAGPSALAAARAAEDKAPVAEGATILAPIPRPAKNIFCVGKNYHEHAKEFASSGFDATAKEVVPEAPVVFSKPPTSVIGPHDPIPSFLDTSNSTDYEGEIAVVIGTRGRGIREADAYAHVFGYTIVNDVTARTLQHRHRQWILGKGIDGFCPMGPAIVTADAAGTPPRLAISTWVNGELRQRATIDDLIFAVPTLIATISAAITLEPGDIIATGTPAGVGIGFTPPRFLKPGDKVRIEVPGIGVLENPVA
ncbi:fumarylacetoacetate hydrolase family protein [Roseomonas eburnea]|uniref:Fumarylacetoacetate hydrolase family protein n=1 Tax=Neoroseomonas eburnea TaxID=1346889 RepID=A0A9X9XFP9_9PROT|nr:fumarylacetoacetate hydrolase family protein [Neoroseomonas eburnea]MBR0682535.1 fumarylacetoacetate hydrolase family protein [Neoroseomonas eburnea]